MPQRARLRPVSEYHCVPWVGCPLDKQVACESPFQRRRGGQYDQRLRKRFQLLHAMAQPHEPNKTQRAKRG
jgi:hypothetical protein